MTSTTAPAATRSACTSVILASDFSDSMTDRLRHTWTVGKMYHLIKALAGRPVAITTDSRTGFTEFNVTLEGTYNGAWGAKVTVKHVYDADPENGRGYNLTDYSLRNTGEAIIVLPTEGGRNDVKWEALKSYRDHMSAAIREAQKMAEGTGRDWGKWTADVVSGQEVSVKYEPSTGNPYFADKWGKPGRWTVRIEG